MFGFSPVETLALFAGLFYLVIMMIISEERHEKLYRSISKPIMDLRILIAGNKKIDIDQELFDLENKIYQEVKSSLNLNKAK